MKKIIIYALLLPILVSSACSIGRLSLAPEQALTATPTRILSPTPTASVTLTQPLPTFTFTPTLIGYKSPTPTPEDTLTPTITLTLTDIYSNITPFTPTPNVTLNGFDFVRTSSTMFYTGRGCEPTSVKFTAQTVGKTKASYVVLFVRLMSRTSGVKSEWTSITINNDGSNIFTYSLTSEEIKSVDAYQDPWVQYQLVATTADSKEVGRTGIFEEYLSLLRCVPTETPTPTVTPTITPTP